MTTLSLLVHVKLFYRSYDLEHTSV